MNGQAEDEKSDGKNISSAATVKICYEKVALLDNFFQLVERTADFVV